MSQQSLFPIRKECPPGACVCDREILLNDPKADIRVLKLTSTEEKRLAERIENISSYAELQRIQERIHEQLGVVLQITPSTREVRTIRGLNIQLLERPGLCKKIRQSIPAAVRRCLDKNPDIVYAILNAHDLFGEE